MARRRHNLKLAFLDSSVLFSATSSPTGTSAKLFTIKRLKLCTSTLVLTETERNIRKKLEFYHLERFLLLVNQLKIIKAIPNQKQIAQAQKIKVNLIFTLDQKHFLTDLTQNFIKPAKILTPKLFFQNPNL